MRKISFECTFGGTIVSRGEDGQLSVIGDAVDGFQRLGKTILIDGGQHTNNIEIWKAPETLNKFQIIGPGKDGMIIENITDEDIILMVPLADCGGIGFKHKSGTSLGMIHAGYKGIYSDIIGKFVSKTKEIDDLENFSFYMAPMVGKNYEFSTKDYEKNFNGILEKYNLKPSNYFQTIDENHGYLNLKKLTLDILRKNGVSIDQLDVSTPETNNPRNNYASHRLHTLAKRIQTRIKDEYGKDIIISRPKNKRIVMSKLKFTQAEEEVLKSGKYVDYLFGRRNLFIIKTGDPIIPKRK